MLYIFSVAIRYLWRHRWLYLLLLLELTLCLSLVFIGINKTYSEDKRLASLEEQTSNLYMTNLYNRFRVFNREEYDHLSQIIPNQNDILYMEFGRVDYVDQSQTNFFHILIVNEGVLNTILPDRTDSDVYVGQRVVDALTARQPHFFNSQISLSQRSISIDQHEFSYSPFHHQKERLTLTPEYEYDIVLDHAIIIKKSALEQFEGNVSWTNQAHLAFRHTTHDIDGVIGRVNQSIEGLDLQGIHVVEQFNAGSRDLIALLRVLSWSGLVALVIVFTGILGVILLMIEKRKQKQAISLLFGASPKVILLELFLEVYLFTNFASLLAVFIALNLSKKVSSIYYLIEFYDRTYYLAILLPLIIATLPVVLNLSVLTTNNNLAKLSKSE